MYNILSAKLFVECGTISCPPAATPDGYELTPRPRLPSKMR